MTHHTADYSHLRGGRNGERGERKSVYVRELGVDSRLDIMKIFRPTIPASGPVGY